MDPSYHNVIQDISDVCKEKCIDASDEFIYFLVNLASLEIEGSFERLSKENRKKFSKNVIKILLNKLKPSSVALKLQYYFAKNYDERENLIKAHRTRLAYKTAPLVREICDFDRLESSRDEEILYQKMLVVIIILSGMGSPLDTIVLREVTIAMESVFQPSELPHYVALTKLEKEEQLMELVFIVTGIRLFNHDCQQGGEEIDDLPGILQEWTKIARTALINSLENLMEKIYKITAAIDANIPDDENPESPNSESKTPTISYYTEMLALARQQEIFIRKLLSDLEMSEKEIKPLINRHKLRLRQIHETVKSRTSIPTNEVYPQFKDLAEIWLRLQDEMIALSNIEEVFQMIKKIFPLNFDRSKEQYLDELLKGVEVLTDAKRLERTMGQSIRECGKCTVSYMSGETDLENMNLQFLGFCAWSFVTGKGALIPANPNIGILNWKNKFYVFKSVDAAKKFGKNPERFRFKAMEFAKENPCYIHLFQILQDMKNQNLEEKQTTECPPLKARQDQKIQTEIHVFRKNIDPDYSHSLWEHRKRALTYASLCNCRTRGMQTNETNSKNTIWVQTYASKDQEVQTMKDNSTNTPSVNTKYIFGLRGKSNDVIAVNCSYHTADEDNDEANGT